MTDTPETPKKVLSLSDKGKVEARKVLTLGGSGQVSQQFSHGRTNAVTVVKKRTVVARPGDDTKSRDAASVANEAATLRTLSDSEREARLRALRDSKTETTETRSSNRGQIGQLSFTAPVREATPETESPAAKTTPAPEQREQNKPAAHTSETRAPRNTQNSTAPAGVKFGERIALNTGSSQRGRPSFSPPPAPPASTYIDQDRAKVAERSGAAAAAKYASINKDSTTGDDDARKAARDNASKMAPKRSTNDMRRGGGRMSVTQALNSGEDGGIKRGRSEASWKRAQMKRHRGEQRVEEKIAREVTLPETITVQELASRMAERGADVIKCLMRMGVMATINQVIDADTAELVATELGHKIIRVADSDIEMGLGDFTDTDDDLLPRPPVVTIMGHVDHGKTSLLDAIRQTDVVSGESGGITQHIGAYQITMPGGQKITFLDTPGHAAFSEMRSRGARVTDVVVLVVAADDSIMPQTIEAISHAKAAGVPMIVAINKIDKPAANPLKVKQELLQHNVQVEEMGGDVLCIEVSAKQKTNLDKLEEAILLQAEILNLRANPNRPAAATVVEARQERGRGAVATVLVEKGTLKAGDLFVTGTQWGRVRALHDDRGKTIHEAMPGKPVEVIGLSGVPQAGDDFIVVENEEKARSIAEYRERKKRELLNLATQRSSLEQMFSQIKAGEKREMAVIVKADVHGSVEAIAGAINKIAADNTEVAARVLHTGVGAINESDITLAKASNAMMIGFNVRANPQARDLAKRDGIEIRYYSIIYNIVDDIKAILTGMLKPNLREQFLGNAAIRQVFNITKVGKVAGCMVTEGLVKRGAKVRLLRDNVVIHDGTLKTLKRFKEEVREAKEGFECGMAFENYDDIRDGDVIEAYEMIEEARTL